MLRSDGKITFVNKPQQNQVFKKFAYISGAVNKPGVYEISDSTRVLDLINLAEGFTAEADSNFIGAQLNLSEKLSDGTMIFIPAKGDALSTSNESKINVNTASLQELATLPGIGESTAQLIIDNRPYASVEDLLNVPRIGDKTLEKIRGLITIE